MAKILVIDDSVEFCKLMRRVLKVGQHDAIEAHSGAEGLQCAEAEQPDLILLDYMMPGMDGFEVCRCLRAGEKTRHIPVIMITAFAGVDYQTDRLAALRLGLDDYLTKPVSPSALNHCVADVLHRYEQMGRIGISPPPQPASLPDDGAPRAAP